MASFTSSPRRLSWSGTEYVTARRRYLLAIIILSPFATATLVHWATFESNSRRSPAQFGKGVDYVLHAILHRIVDQYLPIFEMIEDDVLAMERRSLDDFLGETTLLASSA